MSVQLVGIGALEVDAVECAPLGKEKILIRLRGRWPGRSRGPDRRTMLVVEDEGRRHRFPALPQPRRSRPNSWSASFAVPAWLAPRLQGRMTLSMGDGTVPVPPVSASGGEPPVPFGGGSSWASPEADPPSRETEPSPSSGQVGAGEEDPGGTPAPGQEPEPGDRPEAVEEHGEAEHQPSGSAESNTTSRIETESEPRPEGLEPGAEAGESSTEAAGPSSESTGVDPEGQTVVALRSELRERIATMSRVSGLLADAQAELEARAAVQARLESTQAELRGELDQLRSLIEQERSGREEVETRSRALASQLEEVQREVADVSASRDSLAEEREQLARDISSLRSELASTVVSRDAAISEAEGLRAELDRLGADLATARSQPGVAGGGLAEAEALLAEARALTDSLRDS